MKLIEQASQELTNSDVYKKVNLKLQKLNNLEDNNDMMTKFQNTSLWKQCLKKVAVLEERKKQLQNTFDINELKDCLMVDPSFNRLEEFGSGQLFDKYIGKGILTLNQVNAIPSNSRLIGQGFPLGYLKDLIPEIANSTNKNSMIGLMDLHGVMPLGIDINKLNKNHPFVKFIDKLNGGITE